MEYAEIRAIIESHGGDFDRGINWTWSGFPSESACRAAFDAVKDHVEHRGVYPPDPNDESDSWAFRWR